jgi:hypothetical protein
LPKKKIIIFVGSLFIIISSIVLLLKVFEKITYETAVILLTAILIPLGVITWAFQDPTEKIIDTLTDLFKLTPKQEEPVETPTVQPNAIEKPNVQVDVRKEQVALAVSAIIFHKTSNPPKILFCWSGKQERYILPGGHFYKRVGDANEKIPVWSVNPDTRPADFLLEEKLKDKYGIIAHLDEDFHHESEDIRGMATIEPTPFLNLFEKPSHDDGHVWHFDFYYMCKIESPEDSKLDNDHRFKWWLLEDVQQMVKKKKTFANLQEVIEVAIDKNAKKAITDKRGEEL